jgi:hypothetical protein
MAPNDNSLIVIKALFDASPELLDVNSGKIPPIQTTRDAFSGPYNSDIKSVHKNVIGYGRMPIATIVGISTPKKHSSNLRISKFPAHLASSLKQ